MRKNGFTLVEILIATLIIALSSVFFTRVVASGRSLLRQQANKNAVNDLIAREMESILAKSYSSLAETPFPPPVEEMRADNNLPVKVTTAIIKRYEPPLIVSAATHIPYMEIIVSGEYSELINGSSSVRRQISMTNIIPYPYIHSLSAKLDISSSNQVVFTGDPRASGATQDFSSYGDIGTGGLALDIDFETPKDIIITYNIALKIDPLPDPSDPSNPNNQIATTDTVWTACFIDSDTTLPANNPLNQARSIITETPIISQPFITNSIAFSGADFLPAGPHKVVVKWRKSADRGEIFLRNAELIIAAFDHQ